VKSLYDYEFTLSNGQVQALSAFRGKVLLIVNTASKCGLTPQFEGLEKLYRDYADRGLEIIGFPCNQFAHQDPGSDQEIVEFCQRNYGVSFPMAQKIDVNGSHTHPLYKFLKDEAPGLLGSRNIKWNFTKFLVDRDGKVLERFAPQATPESIERRIAELL